MRLEIDKSGHGGLHRGAVLFNLVSTFFHPHSTRPFRHPYLRLPDVSRWIVEA